MLRQSATYQKIQKWVLDHHQVHIKTCWIAHAKEIHGLPLREAPNRQGEERVEPCPPEVLPAITDAFRHFGMLS